MPRVGEEVRPLFMLMKVLRASVEDYRRGRLPLSCAVNVPVLFAIIHQTTFRL